MAKNSYEKQPWSKGHKTALAVSVAVTGFVFAESRDFDYSTIPVLVETIFATDGNIPSADTSMQTPLETPIVSDVPIVEVDSRSAAVTALGLTGTIYPCDIHARADKPALVPKGDGVDWSNITASGELTPYGTDGTPIKVYVREACSELPTRTVVLASSVHGTENGGHLISHDILFSQDIPDDVRVIALPEINKSATVRTARSSTSGVDLNRNFDYLWANAGSEDPGDKFYRGPSPASEPETQAVTTFLSKVGRAELFISFHDQLGYVSAIGSTPGDLAATYVNTMGTSDSGQPYSDLRSIGAVSGSLDGWFHSATGSNTLLVEMTNSRKQPYLNAHIRAVKFLLESTLVQ